MVHPSLFLSSSALCEYVYYSLLMYSPADGAPRLFPVGVMDKDAIKFPV